MRDAITAFIGGCIRYTFVLTVAAASLLITYTFVVILLRHSLGVELPHPLDLAKVAFTVQFLIAR